jgi:TonB dependent receptor-like, beta-barrel
VGYVVPGALAHGHEPVCILGEGLRGRLPKLTGNPNFGTQVAPGLTLANTAFVIGDQQHLDPERARNWSTGLDLTPHWIEGLKVSATYYHIDYTNQIFAPSVFPAALLSPGQYQIYSSFVHPVHNPASCTPGNPSTYDPALLPYLSAVGSTGSSSLPRSARSSRECISTRTTPTFSGGSFRCRRLKSYDLDALDEHDFARSRPRIAAGEGGAERPSVGADPVDEQPG